MHTTLSVIVALALMGLACEGIPNSGDYYPKGGYHGGSGDYYPAQTHDDGSYYRSQGYPQNGGSYPAQGYPQNGGSYPAHGYPQNGGSYPAQGYPQNGGSYPFYGSPQNGGSYPFYGSPQRGNNLNLPPNCNSIACFVPACTVTTCRNFPQARCVGFCNSCVARFFIGTVNVTPFCGGITTPGRPHKKY